MEAPIAQFNHIDRFKDKTSRSIKYTLTYEDGIRVDLTGATITCEFRRHDKDGQRQELITNGNGITVTNATNGEFEIDQVDVLDWPIGTYYYDIVVEFVDGSKIVYVAGTRKVLPTITKLD